MWPYIHIAARIMASSSVSVVSIPSDGSSKVETTALFVVSTDAGALSIVVRPKASSSDNVLSAMSVYKAVYIFGSLLTTLLTWARASRVLSLYEVAPVVPDGPP